MIDELAIDLLVSGAIDCETLIADIQERDGNGTAMKSLIKCS
ncbi:MAG: hypothetical protein V3V05_07325 [Pontiella sp.]